MRVLSFDTDPFFTVPFLNAGKGQGSFYVDSMPVHSATVDKLPEGISAIIATADLQGRARFEDTSGGPPPLLGEYLPERLISEILPSLDLPSGKIGVLLAGDFYTVPMLDKRGGSGDVTEVWRAFGDTFDWVAGVAGNHDTFGELGNSRKSWRKTQNRESVKRRLRSHRLHFLEQDRVVLDDLAIAGISGIIGSPEKLQRRTEEEYLFAIQSLLEQPTDILVMHDGPDDPVGRQRGWTNIREAIEPHGPLLVVRGHSHWNQPFVELTEQVQVINVDCRTAILRSA